MQDQKSLEQTLLGELCADEKADELDDLPDLVDISHENHTLKKRHQHSTTCSHGCAHAHENHQLLKGIIGVLWGVALMVLTVAGYDLSSLMRYCITGATALATLYLGKGIYASAIKSLIYPQPDKKNQRLTMDTLYTISTLTIMIVSILGLFIPKLFGVLGVEVAPLILGMSHLGRFIEHSLTNKVKENLTMCSLVTSDTVKKITNDGEEDCLISELKVDDVILVKSGELIPVDGECLEEGIPFDTSMTDGQAYTILSKNQKFSAGAKVLDENLSVPIKVTATFANSSLSIRDKYMREEEERSRNDVAQQTSLEEKTGEIFKYFVPVLLFIAIVSGVTIGLLSTLNFALESFIAVMVGVCPCALQFVAALALRVALNKVRNGNDGIDFKNRKTLGEAADVNAIVLDVHGTATQQKLVILSYESLDGEFSDRKILQYAKLLEAHSSHALAKAIFDFKAGISAHELSEFKLSDISKLDRGVKAKIDDVEFMVGTKKMLRVHGIVIPEFPRPSRAPEIVYIVRAGKVIGRITAEDRLRPEAKRTIRELSKRYEVHLCTGGEEDAAKYYAAELGIPEKNIGAECVVPGNGENTKLAYIKKLQAKGKKVLMVGDSGNDTEVVGAKDVVGVAMDSGKGEGNKGTQKNADIVIKDLRSIPRILDIARRMKSATLQGLMVSLFYNTTVVLFAALVLPLLKVTLNPVMGIGMMILETCVVLGRLAWFKMQKIQEVPEILEVPCGVLGGSPYVKPGLGRQQPLVNSENSAAARPIADQSRLLLRRPAVGCLAGHGAVVDLAVRPRSRSCA